MGMVCAFHRVNAAEMAGITDSPESAVKLAFGDADEIPIENVRMPGCLGLLLRLTPITVSQVKPRPDGEAWTLPEDPRGMETEFWDTMQFLLTGTLDGGEFPASFIVDGGERLEVEDDETDLRVFSPEAVREIAAYLRSVSLEDLRARFDTERMVKLRIFSKRGPDAANEAYLEVVLAEFEEVRKFVNESAESGEGLLVGIS